MLDSMLALTDPLSKSILKIRKRLECAKTEEIKSPKASLETTQNFIPWSILKAQLLNECCKISGKTNLVSSFLSQTSGYSIKEWIASKAVILETLESMNSFSPHCQDVNKAVLNHFEKNDESQELVEDLSVFDEADMGEESGRQLFLNIRSKSEGSNSSLRIYLVNSSEFAESVSDLETCLHNFWKAGERCKSMKLCLQLVKHLNYERYLGLPEPMEYRFIDFYPAKFMMVTGVLETFQSLLIARLCCDAMLPKAANWFEKVSSVRELLNRIYIVSCILKPLFLVGYLNTEKVMSQGTQLLFQCRGLENLIVTLYSQCWIVWCLTSLLDQQENGEAKELLFDKNLLKIPINDFVVLWPQNRCYYASLYRVLAPAVLFLYQASIRPDLPIADNYNFFESLRSPPVVSEWNSRSFLQLQLKEGPIEPLLSAIMNSESELFLLENAENLAQLLSKIPDGAEAKLPLFVEYCFIVCKLAPHLEYQQALHIFEMIWPQIMSFDKLKDQLTCLDACCDFVLRVKCLPGLIFAEINKKVSKLTNIKQTLIGDQDLENDTEIGQIVHLMKSICQKVVKNNNFEIKILLENENFQSFLDLFNQNSGFLDLCSQLLNRFNNEHLCGAKMLLPDKALSYDEFLLGINLVKRIKNSINRLSAQFVFERASNLIFQVVSQMPDITEIGPDKTMDLLIECRSFSYKFPNVLSFLVQRAIKLSFDNRENLEMVTKALTFGLLTSTQVKERLLKLKMLALMSEVLMKHDRVHSAHTALVIILEDLKNEDVKYEIEAQEEFRDLICTILQLMVQIPDVQKIVKSESNRIAEFEELLQVVNKIDVNITNEEMKLKAMMVRNFENLIQRSSDNDKWDLLDKESRQKMRDML